MRTGQIWISKLNNAPHEIVSLSETEVTVKTNQAQLYKLNKIIFAMQFFPLEENFKQKANRTLAKLKSRVSLSGRSPKDGQQIVLAGAGVVICVLTLGYLIFIS